MASNVAQRTQAIHSFEEGFEEKRGLDPRKAAEELSTAVLLVLGWA
jgi:hypothetical protein